VVRIPRIIIDLNDIRTSRYLLIKKTGGFSSF
jgi:hypothetical protein